MRGWLMKLKMVGKGYIEVKCNYNAVFGMNK